MLEIHISRQCVMTFLQFEGASASSGQFDKLIRHKFATIILMETERRETLNIIEPNQSGFSTGAIWSAARLSFVNGLCPNGITAREHRGYGRYGQLKEENLSDWIRKKLIACKSTTWTYLLMSHCNLNCKIHYQQHWELAWILSPKSPQPIAASSLRGLGLRRSKIYPRKGAEVRWDRWLFHASNRCTQGASLMGRSRSASVLLIFASQSSRASSSCHCNTMDG